MSDNEALCELGYRWRAVVKLCNDDDVRGENAENIRNWLNQVLKSNGTYVRVRKVFNVEELYVYALRGIGLRTDYGSLLEVIMTDSRCIELTIKILEGNASIVIPRQELTRMQIAAIQAFVVILCASEVGRGYSLAPLCALDFLKEYKPAENFNRALVFMEFSKYMPCALTYRDDKAYEIDSDSDSDSDWDSDWDSD